MSLQYVYVLMTDDYDGPGVLGVYSDHETAKEAQRIALEEALETVTLTNGQPHVYDRTRFADNLHIVEVVLDADPPKFGTLDPLWQLS